MSEQLNTWKEEIVLAGNQLVDKIKELMEEGSVRRLIIRKPDGESLLEIPLNPVKAASEAVSMIQPLMAGIGAMAALITQVKIEVVREGSQEESKTE